MSAPAPNDTRFRSEKHRAQWASVQERLSAQRQKQRQALDLLPELVERLRKSEKRSSRALKALAGGKKAKSKAKKTKKAKKAKKETEKKKKEVADESESEEEAETSESENSSEEDSSSEEEEQPKKSVKKGSRSSEIAREAVKQVLSELARIGQNSRYSGEGEDFEGENEGEGEEETEELVPNTNESAKRVRFQLQRNPEVDPDLPREPTQIERGARRLKAEEADPSAEELGIANPYEQAAGADASQRDAKFAEEEAEFQATAQAGLPQFKPPKRGPAPFTGVRNPDFDKKNNKDAPEWLDPPTTDAYDQRRGLRVPLTNNRGAPPELPEGTPSWMRRMLGAE